MTIDTRMILADAQPQRLTPRQPVIFLAGLFVVTLGVGLRIPRSIRRTWMPSLILAIATCGLLGCTNIFVPIGAITPGTYSIQVSATDLIGKESMKVLTLIVTK